MVYCVHFQSAFYALASFYSRSSSDDHHAREPRQMHARPTCCLVILTDNEREGCILVTYIPSKHGYFRHARKQAGADDRHATGPSGPRALWDKYSLQRLYSKSPLAVAASQLPSHPIAPAHAMSCLYPIIVPITNVFDMFTDVAARLPMNKT